MQSPMLDKQQHLATADPPESSRDRPYFLVIFALSGLSRAIRDTVYLHWGAIFGVISFSGTRNGGPVGGGGGYLGISHTITRSYNVLGKV